MGFRISMIDDPFVTNILFYPRKTRKPTNLPSHIQLLEFSIHEKVIIGGIMYIKDKSFPSILLFHGNGEIAEDYQYFYKMFHDIDLNIAVVDYRGYGFSSGKPNFTSLIQDALPVYYEFQKWRSSENYSSQIFVMGRSLGSICVSEIGATNPQGLTGIIFESGIASLYNMMVRLFGFEPKDIIKETLEEISNDTKMRRIIKPTLVIHGTEDTIIPFSEAQLTINSLIKVSDVQFLPIKGAGHNDIFSFTQEYFDGLKRFVSSV